jgi:hypothetical protein
LDDNKVEKVTRLRQLEGENRRLKQAVVELTLDKKALEDLLNQAW